MLTIAADTCRNCSLVYGSCNCRQFNPSYVHGRSPSLHYRDDGQNSGPLPTGIFPGAEGIGGSSGSGVGAASSQSTGRVHVRTTMDGLAGIGRGTTFGPPGSWPAPRFLYIPSLGAYGARGTPQQSGVGNNNQMDPRLDLVGRDLPAAHSAPDMHSQGGTASNNTVLGPGQPDLTSRTEDSSKPASIDAMLSNMSITKSSTQEWEGGEGGSILLDLNTPLRCFPPFRFG